MKFTCSTILLILLSIGICSAQLPNRKHLDLKAVRKIELVEDGGGVSGSHLVYQVEREKVGHWVSKRVDGGDKVAVIGEIPKGQSSREIPERHLIDLLNILAHPVTVKDIKQFKINQDTLISFLDSIGGPISPEKKALIVKDIKNQVHLQKAFEMLLMPRKADDRTSYQIKLVMLGGDTIVAKAMSFADPYIPWSIDGVSIYDPKLTRLYDYLCGNERYEPSRRDHLYRSLIFELLKLH